MIHFFILTVVLHGGPVTLENIRGDAVVRADMDKCSFVDKNNFAYFQEEYIVPAEIRDTMGSSWHKAFILCGTLRDSYQWSELLDNEFKKLYHK